MAFTRTERTSTRRDTFRRTLVNAVYKEEEVLKCSAKLPDGKSVIGRMMYLCKTVSKGQRQTSVEEGSKIVANELKVDF